MTHQVRWPLDRVFRVGTSFKANENVFGVLVGTSADILLMREFVDFYDCGWVAIRVNDISLLRRYASDVFHETILRGEGILGFVTDWQELPPINCMLDLLTHLHAQREFLLLDRQPSEDPEEDCSYAGIVHGLGDNSIVLRCVDSLGRWEDRQEHVPVDRIIRVSFGGPFTRLFWKHVKLQECE